ncbi:putative hydrolase [Corynebacterium kutscheri]|uniref:Putative hydrolase n=2 Tax=Corynebacterium kutscheri TaxID=35755 RepID=A0A0F6R0W2_9CORY|nr:putative hydrolase [Corynebacterium kutscheri]VEH10284.1 Uncharacterized conserved protein [Corynebacterium kutscheri]
MVHGINHGKRGSVVVMNSNGFGFSFNFGGGDDDRDNNNPFGAGGLGDMLNQFGQMLSGMGSSMNSPDGQGPVNYSLAQRIARQQIGTPAVISDSDSERVAEAIRLVELWLDDTTILPASNNKVETWNEEQWLTHTLPMWKRLVTPVAENMNNAQLDALPEEAREMVGPMLNMMNQMSGMNFGMQLGNALGDLSEQALSGTDFALPLAPAGVSALLVKNLDRLTADLSLPQQDVLIYLAACEAARQRLFNHVPWLAEQLVASVEEYAAGLVIDTSHIEEAMRDMNLESGDPNQIQDAMQRLQGIDLSPKISSRNAAASSRLETLFALIEGWVHYVVPKALAAYVPTTEKLHEAFKRRRASGGSTEQAFSKVVGIEFQAPRIDEASELWSRVTNAVGTQRRDQVWDHPDFLPTAEDITNSAEFIDSLLDTADSNYDPIAEIEALEELLKNGQESDGYSAEDELENKKNSENNDESTD